MKFPYQDVNADTTPTGRFYHTPFGPTPSVTTILSSQPKAAGLQAWIDSVGVEESERIRDEAGRIGTHMHNYLEQMVSRASLDEPADDEQRLGRKMAQAMRMIMLKGANLNEVWGLETALWYQDLYAGRTDLVGVWQGVPSVIDYKTSRRAKTVDMVEGYFCQTVAYALAHNDLFGTDIRQTVVLIANRPDFRGDINLQKFVVSGSDFSRYAEKWVGILDSYLASA